jgi:hypothetical protein
MKQIKRINIIFFCLITFMSLSNAITVYENAEDGKVDGWRIQGDGDEPKNIHSPSLDSQVIRLEGRGGPWILGGVSGDLAWKNSKEKKISWKMVTGSRYTIYIPVTTKNGTRYLFYNDLPKRILRHGVKGGILHGLGGYKHDEYKGIWRDYTRDLEADLKDSEPDNELISVNGFIYSGANVSIDNILLYNPKETIYEDGSNSAKWTVSDNSPEGATIKSIKDPQGDHTQGLVIELHGSKMDNGYKINIDNSKDSIIQWKSRFYETYSVSLKVKTEKGDRELLYTNSNNYYPSGGLKNDGKTIWHELGGRSLIGENGWEQRLDFGAVNHFWQTVTRDLNQDLKDFEPNNRFVSISSFEIRGSGLIDDIKMLSRAVVPNPKDDIIYEDGESGTNNWKVYDNSPDGAKVEVVNDKIKGKVISFNGNGIENGYEIGARRGDNKWNNRDHKAISWSMNFNKDVFIYVAIDTANGARYLKYEPRDKDRGKVGNYIRFGIGKDINSGEWKTINRNIESDLHKFEPENRLIAINALLVRGDGKIDDIKSMLDYKTHIEDAEDGKIDDWRAMDNGLGEANITNIKDDDRESRVISPNGKGKSDDYIFGDGEWNTFSKDLDAEIRRIETDNRLIAVDSFRVLGSGLIDDIETY